ncbi:hypothetical protein BDW62DRAFT_187983 [Aspergillus aurantiobrunneus]
MLTRFSCLQTGHSFAAAGACDTSLAPLQTETTIPALAEFWKLCWSGIVYSYFAPLRDIHTRLVSSWVRLVYNS